MDAVVTVKMTPREFDLLRRAAVIGEDEAKERARDKGRTREQQQKARQQSVEYSELVKTLGAGS